MISQIIKEIEPLVSTDLEGNRYVKEEDVTAIACKYALSPDALGRVHEALDIREIEVISNDQSEVLVKYDRTLATLGVVCEFAGESFDDLNEVQKGRLVEKIERLVPSVLHLRERLKGHSVPSGVPSWDEYMNSQKIEQLTTEREPNTTGPITPQMRDFVWDYIKTRRTNIYLNDFADTVKKETGMNRSSAFIYVSIIGNWLKGQENTRTMKFADLIYYLKCIKSDCSSVEYENSLKSLENSIAYWEKKIAGNFSRKVEDLLASLKSGKSIDEILQTVVSKRPRALGTKRSVSSGDLKSFFYDVFIEQGKSANTSNSYSHYLIKVCEWEGIKVSVDYLDELKKNISRFVALYNRGGKNADKGDIGNGTVRACVNAYKKHLEESL